MKAASLTISTDEVGQPQARDFWVDVVCKHLVKVDRVDVPEPALFVGSVEQHRLGDARLARIRSRAQRVKRSARQVARDSEATVLLCLQREGRGAVRQDGREAALAPGDLAVVTSERPYEVAFEAPFEQCVMLLSADALRGVCAPLDGLTALRLPASNAAARLLGQALRAVHGGTLAGAEQEVGRALPHLAAACLGTLRHGAASRRSVCLPASAHAGAAGLSQRQFEVLRLLIAGRSNKEIMRTLDVAEGTVKAHLQAIFNRLGVRTRAQAVAVALRFGAELELS